MSEADENEDGLLEYQEFLPVRSRCRRREPNSSLVECQTAASGAPCARSNEARLTLAVRFGAAAAPVLLSCAE